MWESRPSPPPEPSSTTQEVPCIDSSSVALDLSPTSGRPLKRRFTYYPEENHVVPPSSNAPLMDEVVVRGSKKLKGEQAGDQDGIWVEIKKAPLKLKSEPEVKIISICADAYQEGRPEPIPIRTYGYQVIVTKDEEGEVEDMEEKACQDQDNQVKSRPIKKRYQEKAKPSSYQVTSKPVVTSTEAFPKRKRPQPSISITETEEPPVKKSKPFMAKGHQEITAEPVPVIKASPSTTSPVNLTPKRTNPKALLIKADTNRAAGTKEPEPEKTTSTSPSPMATSSTSKKRKVLKKRRKKSQMKGGGSPKILFSGDVAHSGSDSEREISTSSEDEDGFRKPRKDAALVDEHFQRSLGHQVFKQIFSTKNSGPGHEVGVGASLFQQTSTASTAVALQNQSQISGSLGVSNAVGLQCCYICGFGPVAMTCFGYLHNLQQPTDYSNLFQLGPFPPALAMRGFAMVQGTGGSFKFQAT